MKYTELGRSNMRVSKICLGTMHFGPYASEEVSHQILDRCLELGINFIDTANVYGGAGTRGARKNSSGTGSLVAPVSEMRWCWQQKSTAI